MPAIPPVLRVLEPQTCSPGSRSWGCDVQVAIGADGDRAVDAIVEALGAG